MQGFDIIQGDMVARVAVVGDHQFLVDRIKFIKIIKDATNCSLIEAKDFVDRFSEGLNELKPSPEMLRVQIRRLIDSIDDRDDLEELLFIAKKNSLKPYGG